MTLAGKIGDARWLMSQQVGQGTPKAFIALLTFWLTSLFASFGLFAPRNATSVLFVTLCAIAIAGAIVMIRIWSTGPYLTTADASGPQIFEGRAGGNKIWRKWAVRPSVYPYARVRARARE